ncbi:hypothetical protein Pan216_41200 [Planctomycetes bacterium Pan216]|uniref:Archease domain-containing protein n=1 Tax=Kolteria novifilia TaxID=2527975 RepID=A0A518B8H1_9BACT|nr:hypothetical protein Pan216_41200 [Planctomycetes bacterium Pan216]
MGQFEFFDHTADIGLRVRAATLSDLLATAILGLMELVYPERSRSSPTDRHEFRLEADSAEFLLVDLLTEALFLTETEGLVIAEVEVILDVGGVVRGEFRTFAFDPRRDSVGAEAKAITYHGLRCDHGPSGWIAEVIIDI